MSLSLGWPALATFAGISGLVLIVLQLLRPDDRRLDNRLDDLETAAEADRGFRPQRSRPPAALRLAFVRAASHLLPRDGGGRTRLQQRLSHAGFYSPSASAAFVTAQLGLPAVLAAAAIWGSRAASDYSLDWLLCGGLAGCFGFLLPGLWLNRRTRQRRHVLTRSLPDFLDLLVSCLEAGLSLEGAIQRVSTELAFAHPLLGQEITRVQAEIELGATPDRALQSFAERTGADIVRTLASVCSQARRFGTRISTALRVHADTLRVEREFLAEEAAQRASVKILFPTLLCLFPAIFIVLAGPAAIQITENFSGTAAQAEQEQNAPRR